MIRLTLTAGRQFGTLVDHYLSRDRPEAADRLVAALREALTRIETDPGAGRPYPANYAEAARWQYRWIKAHRYWFAYSDHRGTPVLTNVLF